MDFRRCTEDLWRIYLTGKEDEVRQAWEMVDPQCVIVGTGAHEYYVGRDSFFPALREELLERRDIHFRFQNFWCEQLEASPDAVLVYGGIHIWWERGDGKTGIDMDSRFSILYRRKEGKWRVIHIHQSIPFRAQMEGEYYPKTLLKRVQEAQSKAEELEELAQKDSLTGTYNYRAFARIWESWKRGDSWMFLLDLDNFKKVNDTCGHMMGNRVLNQVANILQSSVRSRDVVCRMGGDEFLLLCGELEGKERAEMLARRILQALRQGALPEAGDNWPTVSMGITDVRENDSMELAVERADRALYRVKRREKGSYSQE